MGALAVSVLLALAPAFADDSAEKLFRQGLKAQRSGDDLQAYLFFNRARAFDPASSKYIAAVQRVRRPAAQLVAASGNVAAALAMAPAAEGLPKPAVPTATVEITSEADKRVLKAPVHLQPNDHVRTFRFRKTIKDAYEEVAAEYGLDVIFDEDLKSDNDIRVDLADCNFRCVMFALGDVGTTLAIPLTERLFLIADDNANKRRELEPVASVNIPLNNAVTPEDVTQIGQAIQQSLEMKRFQMSPSSGMLFLRDTVSKVNMARAMVDALMQPRAAVMIELRLISANRDRTANLGITLPQSFPVTNFSTILNAVPPSADGSVPLIGIGGGETTLGVSIGDARAEARFNSGVGSQIQTMSVRTQHGMPAEVKIGERFPIVNAQFSAAPGTGGDDPNFIQPIPSFTFEDLGLNLKVTPQVHSATEVTMEIETEFRLLAGGAVNGVPILANRQFASTVRLKEGEFAIVSGMGIFEHRNNRSGPAGLANIPILGQLFSSHTRQFNQSDLLILVRPRIVRLPPAEIVPTLTFRFGPEQRPLPAL